MKIGWETAAGTHVGRRRKGNEDAYRVDEERGIFIVADGMGGHAAGEIASRLAADAALETLTGASLNATKADERLLASFEEAHHRIVTFSSGDPDASGMGTTLTVALLSPSGTLEIGHIGDSRVYHLADDTLRQITHDHSWVQQEVDAGRIAADASGAHPLSHILTRVLSAGDSPRPDLVATMVRPGDLLLLCSDGLYNMVDRTDLLDTLRAEGPLPKLIDKLVATANRNGGADNITAIVVKIT